MATEADWRTVDRYLVELLVREDDALVRAREDSRRQGLPAIEVAPNQGKLLALVAGMVGARRVLEFGTLGGYSAIWLARAVGEHGQVTTLEIDPDHAAVAEQNFALAGVADRVEVILGPALESVRGLVTAAVEPFDLVFIDADKPNNSAYLRESLHLVRPGSVVVCDNVVRHGAVADPDTVDPSALGSRQLLADLAHLEAEGRLEATALQTVGSKGWDGLAIAVVR